MKNAIKLVNEKPVIFFDLETTGVRPTDRIVEIAAIKVQLGQADEELYFLLNPERSIPAEATAVHGITDGDVAEKPTFKNVAVEVQQFFNGCDLGGFNVRQYDIPLLNEELINAGQKGIQLEKLRIVDVCALYHKKEPRNLEAAVQYYTGENHEKAHSALGDVKATIRVLAAQINQYPDLDSHVERLHDYTWGPDESIDFEGWFVRGEGHRPHYARGKHKGLSVESEPGFLDWMVGRDFITTATKRLISSFKEEAEWRATFRRWLKDSGLKVTIPLLDSVLDCLKSRQSCGIVVFRESADSAVLVLTCDEQEPVEFHITCPDCVDYLISYLLYAIKKMEQASLDVSKYSTLVTNLQSIPEEDCAERLTALYQFLQKGLDYAYDDFHRQYRFKKLYNSFKSTKEMMNRYLEANAPSAPEEKLEFIYAEGASSLLLDVALFFDCGELTSRKPEVQLG